MNENEYITQIVIPSRLEGAGKIEGATGAEVSGDELGLPAVLVHMEDKNYVISCIPAGDEDEVWLYRVAEAGFRGWEFVQADPPGDLEVFPFLIRIYDALRGINSETISSEGDENREVADKAAGNLPRAIEDIRLTALSEILTELGLESAFSRDEEGRSALVVMEEEEPVLFSYIAVLPSEDISLLKVEWDGNEVMIPEKNVTGDPQAYERILGNLDALE